MIIVFIMVITNDPLLYEAFSLYISSKEEVLHRAFFDSRYCLYHVAV